tara:strand:+ start:16409 stop:16726 length:318 start_codon:yes stop_codon:yes gene_type:complete
MENPVFEKKMQVGLGEAIRRVNKLHARVNSNLANSEEETEHTLLMDALNEIKIDLGFDCDDDGVPDSIEIFAATAKTSCCRLTPLTKPAPQRKRKTRTSRTRRKR